ncbi:MAG: hypothetical protein ACTSYJ_04770 [Candidatus Thorarchaeota archaeon]
MEESLDKRELIYRHRKQIALIVIMFIVVPLAISFPYLFDDGDSEYDISYTLIVWILPLEEEFNLHLSFYISEQNAEEQVNSLIGTSIEIQPLDDEEHTIYLINLPDHLLSVWVRICFGTHDDEPYIVLSTDIGQKKTSTLLNREISILVEPYLG